MTPQVVVADSTPFVRLAIRVALMQDGITLAGEVASAEAAIDATATRHVDVVLLDSVLDPEMATVAEIRAAHPQVAVIVLCPDASETVALAAVRAGACGVIPKDTEADRLPAIIRGAMAGEAAIPRRVVRRLLDELCAEGRRRSRGRGEGLSPREQDVMAMLCDAVPDRVIARRLRISETTVRRHVATAVQKLGATRRADAVERYRRAVRDVSRVA